MYFYTKLFYLSNFYLTDRGAKLAPFFIGLLMRMKEKTMKEVTDLALASYLSAIRHKLCSYKFTGHKLTFTFENSPKMEEDILAFYNREARVDPLTFAEVFRNLKALTLRS